MKFGELTNDEILEELYNLTVLALPKFKFPRVPLNYVKFTNNDGPDGKNGAYFEEEITQKEITVIVEYMLSLATQKQLAAAIEMDSFYEDANLKLPSVAGKVTQLNRANENQMEKAESSENDYYRSLNNSPTIGNIWNS